jgi:hypothetical protein
MTCSPRSTLSQATASNSKLSIIGLPCVWLGRMIVVVNRPARWAARYVVLALAAEIRHGRGRLLPTEADQPITTSKLSLATAERASASSRTVRMSAGYKGAAISG